MSTVAHLPRVSTTTTPGVTVHRATCLCGWTGPLHTAKAHAHGDAGDHILDNGEHGEA